MRRRSGCPRSRCAASTLDARRRACRAGSPRAAEPRPPRTRGPRRDAAQAPLPAAEPGARRPARLGAGASPPTGPRAGPAAGSGDRLSPSSSSHRRALGLDRCGRGRALRLDRRPRGRRRGRARRRPEFREIAERLPKRLQELEVLQKRARRARVGRALSALVTGRGARRWRRRRAPAARASRAVPPESVTALVNTGDDREFYGVHVSPDLDIVTYTLAGRVDPENGYGLAGDSFARGRGARGARPSDLVPARRPRPRHLPAPHSALRDGVGLAAITEEIRRALGLGRASCPCPRSPAPPSCASRAARRCTSRSTWCATERRTT